MPGLIPFFRAPHPFSPGGRGPALRSAHLATSIGGGSTPVAATATSAPAISAIASQLNIRMYAQQLRNGQGATLQSTCQFTAKSLDRIQDHANSQDRQIGQLGSTGLTRDPSGNITFAGATFTVRAGNQVLSLVNGRMTFGAANAPPNDSDILPQHVSIWLDEGGSQLVFRVRLSDGSLKTGTIALI